jgi:serine/threonine-protein kinase
MRPDSNDRDGSLPLTVRMRIDEICQRFEAAWQTGPAPRLEVYLGVSEGPERAALLRDLLRVELELRPQSNGVLSVEEYLARFPGDEGLIREEFERLNEPQPEDPRDTGTAAATPTSAVSRPETEVSIPGYEVRRRLGVGGMGIVYEALQVKAARPVALKVIRSGEEADPEELKRFRDEAESAARLQHLNIAQIFEVGEHNGRPYFSMELCEAGSLDHYLRGGPLLPTEAAALVETLARAMHHAHQEKVIHRDLKPANILPSPACAAEDERGTTEPSTEEGRVSLSSLTPKVELLKNAVQAKVFSEQFLAALVQVLQPQEQLRVALTAELFRSRLAVIEADLNGRYTDGGQASGARRGCHSAGHPGMCGAGIGRRQAVEMSHTNTNGRTERKTLASQLDRLDLTIDALADGLNKFVADAVREAVTAAVSQTVEAVLRELLSRPELLRQLVPPAAPVTPGEPQPQRGPAPLQRAWLAACTRLASVWVWLRSNAGDVRGTLAERARGYWQRARSGSCAARWCFRWAPACWPAASATWPGRLSVRRPWG